jgi:hypothetical protein
LPQGKSAWKVRDGIGEERDKYYGGFQQVGEDYLFKSKDTAKLVNIFFFFGWIVFCRAQRGKTEPKGKKRQGQRGDAKKKPKKAKKKRKALNERGNTAAPC